MILRTGRSASDATVHADVGAYVLDVLGTAERASFERHLACCEACRREVDEFSATAAALAAITAVEPPHELRARVLSAAHGTRQQPPVVRRLPVPAVTTTAARRWLGAAAAVAVLTLGVPAVTSLVRPPQSVDIAQVLTAPDARTVTLEAGGGIHARLVWSAQADAGVFAAGDLPAVPPGRAYQLWLDDGDRVRPAGQFRPDADATATAMVRGGLADVDAIAVTVERRGDVSAPTGDVVVEGLL